MLSRAAKVRFRDENQAAEDALQDAVKRPLKRAKLPTVADASKKRAALGDVSNTVSALGAGLGGVAKKPALEASSISKSSKVTITTVDKENKILSDKERAIRSTSGLTSTLGKTTSTLGLTRATVKVPSATSAALKTTSSLMATGAARTIVKAKRATSATVTSAAVQLKATTSTRLISSEKITARSDAMEVVLDKSKEEMSEEESESEDEQPATGANKTVIHRAVETVPSSEPSQREPRLSTTHLLSNIFAGVDLEEVEDIDADDRDDPLQCVHLVEDILTVLREREVREKPNPNYMSLQQSINAKMRGILADWMIDVGSTFTLLSETVFLGVRLMDMFLSRKMVSRERIQLVGIASLVIASKFEEIRSPFIEDWIWISDEAYTRDQILRMEKIMLEVLDYSMGVPTPLHFLRRFSKAAKSDARTHTLSKYLTELSMPEYAMLRFSPSTIAAAAVFLARKMTHKTPTWNKTLQHYTKYAANDLIPCAMLLNELHSAPKEGTEAYFVAVKKKYANEGLLAVSTIPGTTFD